MRRRSEPCRKMRTSRKTKLWGARLTLILQGWILRKSRLRLRGILRSSNIRWMMSQWLLWPLLDKSYQISSSNLPLFNRKVLLRFRRNNYNKSLNKKKHFKKNKRRQKFKKKSKLTRPLSSRNSKMKSNKLKLSNNKLWSNNNNLKPPSLKETQRINLKRIIRIWEQEWTKKWINSVSIKTSIT